MNVEKVHHIIYNKEIRNGAKSLFAKYWEYAVDQYGIPFGLYCMKVAYEIYTNLKLFTAILFLIKFIPTVIYMHQFIKYMYVSSRERMKLKQLEIEDLQRQIQIVKTKLSVQDAEFTERAELLRKKAEQFRRVRGRVRKIIASDKELRDALNHIELPDEEPNSQDSNMYGEECKFIMDLLKVLNIDKTVQPELDPKLLSCGENLDQPSSVEESVYSSVSDVNSKQDCHVKIVKVTNVYRVAYLRHFIKQKRLRRANKQELLRKKMDNIKKLLDDWQNTLNMVVNNKLSLLNVDSPQIGIASQEARGDASKGIYNLSDSDSDFRNNVEFCHDDYNMSWSDIQGKVNGCNNYDDLNDYEEKVVASKYYDLREYDQYNSYEDIHDRNQGSGVLYVVPEETNSQLEIREIQNDDD